MPILAGGFIFVFALLIIALAVALFIFWLRMLIDCAKREFAPGSSERVVWIVMLVFFQFIASIVYYFAVYKKPKA